MMPAETRNAAQDLATKAEVEKLRREAAAKIEKLGLQTTVDIAKAKTDLIEWFAGSISFTLALLYIVFIVLVVFIIAGVA